MGKEWIKNFFGLKIFSIIMLKLSLSIFYLNSCASGHVTRVIEILGSYSLSLRELRDILSYLYTGQMKTWVSQCVSVTKSD